MTSNVDYSILEGQIKKIMADGGGSGYNGSMDNSVNIRLATIEGDLRTMLKASIAAAIAIAGLVITSYLMTDSRVRVIETNTSVIIQKLDDLKLHQ